MPPPPKKVKNRSQQIQIRKDNGVVRGQVHLSQEDVYDFLTSIKPPQQQMRSLTKSILDLQKYEEGNEEVSIGEILDRLQRFHAFLQGRIRIEGVENVEGMR